MTQHIRTMILMALAASLTANYFQYKALEQVTPDIQPINIARLK